MKKILADQNFTGAVLEGLRLRVPELDVLRTEDVGIKRFQDEQILAWAADEDRLILTHDAKTFVHAAYERLAKGVHFSGVVLVPANLSIGAAIDEITILLLCTSDDELRDRVVRLPL
jgi:predicted nuclease of predicted toxin-antitoxin system